MSRVRSRTYRTSGVVLRQYPLGEADRIVSILTPDLGKVRAVAKGVRRPNGRLRGHLDLTNVVDFAAAYGRNLDVITEAALRDDHPATREDLARLSHSIYICEVADLFSQERSPGRALYALVTASLEALEDTSDPWLVGRWYELRLLDVTGFRPQLENCVECDAAVEPGDHVLDLAAGGVLCPDCRALGIGHKVPVSESAMRVLRHFQRNVAVDGIGEPTLGDNLRNEVERITSRYIRSIVERDIRSAEFTRRAGSV